MPDKKIIAVVGATGAQGGGLVRAILADRSGEFSVRALTRQPDSDKARALAAAGAEVVAADLDDQASLERAFAGAYGVFALTNFWEHFSPEKELAQAGNMARAAKAAGVRHVIWSTLEDTRRWVPLGDDRMPTLQGKYKVPHFDAKGEADQIFRDARRAHHVPAHRFYWDNLIYFGAGPQKGPDGRLAISFPLGDKKLPGHRGGGHRQGRVRHLQAGRRVHQPHGGHRGGAPDRARRWPRRSAGRWAGRSSTTR